MTTLFHDNQPRISLALLILHEAYVRRVTRIVLLHRGTFFTVNYHCWDGFLEERDNIPSRQWHGLMAALHMLADETAMQHAEKDGDSIHNRIMVTSHFPHFDHAELRAIQNRLEGPLVINLSFTDSSVTLNVQRDGTSCNFA